MRRLKTFVHVGGSAYGPDDEVPPEVAEQIGDHAWEDDGDQGDGGDEPVDVGYVDPTARQQPAGDVEAPPRSGRGSGIEAWRNFLAEHEIAVDSDASREDMIEAAERAGLVEPEQPKE